MQANDVTGKSFFRMFTVTSHESERIGEPNILTDTDVPSLHALIVTARHDPQERNTVPVLWIHVCLNLENEPGKTILGRGHLTHVRRPGLRGRRPIHQAIKHVIDTEVTERGPEKHRGQLTSQEGLLVKLVGSPFDQLDLIAKIGSVIANGLIQLRVIQTFDNTLFLNGMPLA